MTIPKTLGFIGGLADILLLQTFTGEFNLVTKVILYLLSGILVTALTTLGVSALLKLVQLPSKEEWSKLSTDLTSITSKLDKHIAGYEEWRRTVNKDIQELESGK